MKARTLSAISLAAFGLIAATPADDPLTRPIDPASAAKWITPQEPVRLFGNAYLVGFGGLNVALIRTSKGLILIDGAVPQAARQIEANIAQLGFSIRDVKLILSTEPHWDHAGGIAALARDSGATVVASAAAAKVLADGGRDPADPQAAWLEPFPAVRNVRVAKDGEVIRLGDVAVTAVATPGHTVGSMNWRWVSCVRSDCTPVLFASSLNPIAGPGWRFRDHPERAAMFRATIAKMRRQPCGILLSAHPDNAGGPEKLARLRAGARRNPFRDGNACAAYADRAATLLEKAVTQ